MGSLGASGTWANREGAASADAVVWMPLASAGAPACRIEFQPLPSIMEDNMIVDTREMPLPSVSEDVAIICITEFCTHDNRNHLPAERQQGLDGKATAFYNARL